MKPRQSGQHCAEYHAEQKLNGEKRGGSSRLYFFESDRSVRLLSLGKFRYRQWLEKGVDFLSKPPQLTGASSGLIRSHFIDFLWG